MEWSKNVVLTKIEMYMIMLNTFKGFTKSPTFIHDIETVIKWCDDVMEDMDGKYDMLYPATMGGLTIGEFQDITKGFIKAVQMVEFTTDYQKDNLELVTDWALDILLTKDPTKVAIETSEWITTRIENMNYEGR